MSRRLKHGRVLPGRNSTTTTGRIDMTLVALVLGLSLFGLIMVYDASVAVALSRHGERFYFVVDQARNLALGLVSLFIVSRIDYQIIKKFATPIFGIGLLALIAVLIPGLGVEQGGATSWLRLGPLVVQPSYPMAIALIIYLASWLTRENSDTKSWQNHFAPFW